jgi:signal transduction histidine kinase
MAAVERVDDERLRLEASLAIARAVGGDTDLPRVLELIVARGRELVDAAGMAILLRNGPGLVVAATAGDVPPGVELDPTDALVVPLVFHGRSLGLLVALGRRAAAIDGEDERLLSGFAASAATAVVAARTVEQQRLRDVVLSAEAERTRWARELHDSTLQGLGALLLALGSARRADDPARMRAAVDAAVEQLETEIDALRSLIRELRPASLDELGPKAAVEDLAGRTAACTGVEVTTQVALDRHVHELEVSVYRVIQEALANAVRHAGAEHVDIEVTDDEGIVTARICDDGAGFDPTATREGFGLAAMRERVSLLNGTLEIDSAADGSGSCVTALLPIPPGRL